MKASELSMRLLTSGLLWLMLLMTIPRCWGQTSAASTSWKTGADFQRELERPITVTWGGTTLRNELTQFANRRGIGIFIDRRIDPDTPIELRIRDQTFEQILWIVADQHNWSVCRLDDLFYLGPVGVAPRFLALWQQQKDRVRRSRSSFYRQGPKNENVNWPLLSNPSEILMGLAQRHQFEIIPLSKATERDERLEAPLPHDLWPAIELPPISIDEQVGLLLIGFDLWYEPQETNNTIKLVPLPIQDTAQITLGPFPQSEHLSLRDLRAEFPDCSIRRERNQFIIKGPIERMASVNRRLVKSSSVPAGVQRAKAGTAVFSLTTRASRKDLLMAIANDQQLQLRFTGTDRTELDQIIELTVEKVTLDELLSEVIKGTSLNYQIMDDKLEITR